MSNEGKRVKTHYTGTLDDGTKFDSSHDRDEPLEFVNGAGQMIPGFDAAVLDMKVGETVNVRLTPDQAYGERDPRLMARIPVGNIPGLEEVEVGEVVCLADSSGQQTTVTIIEQNDDVIVVDMNHELAGQALNFEITLLEVNDNVVSGCSPDCCSGCASDCC